MKIKEKPLQLYIPAKNWQKLLYYAQAVETEISGFAEVTWNGQELEVGEVYLIEQEAGGAHTTLDELATHKFLLDYIKKGGTQLPRLWWHTHNDFDTFFSGTDYDTIKKLKNDSFLVALCLNKKGDTYAGFYLHQPVEMVVEPLEVYPDIPEKSIPKAILNEVKKKVKEKTYQEVYPRKWNWPKKKKGESKKKVEYLPKNQKKRERLIQSKGLYISYDFELDDYVWKDKRGHAVWLEANGEPPFGKPAGLLK